MATTLTLLTSDELLRSNYCSGIFRTVMFITRAVFCQGWNFLYPTKHVLWVLVLAMVLLIDVSLFLKRVDIKMLNKRRKITKFTELYNRCKDKCKRPEVAAIPSEKITLTLTIQFKERIYLRRVLLKITVTQDDELGIFFGIANC